MLFTLPALVHLLPVSHHTGLEFDREYIWRGEISTGDDPGRDPTISVHDPDTGERFGRHPGHFCRVDRLPCDGPDGAGWFGRYRREIAALVEATPILDLDDAARVVAEFVRSGVEPSEVDQHRLSPDFGDSIAFIDHAIMRGSSIPDGIEEWARAMRADYQDNPERLSAIFDAWINAGLPAPRETAPIPTPRPTRRVVETSDCDPDFVPF